MKEETNKQIFRREIAKWYRLNKINRGYNSQYLSILHETIQKHCKVPISFDSRYADAIRFCISESLFTVFCEQDQTASLQIYRNMSRKLYQRGLISKRHCFDIDRIKPFNITCKINQFLIRMQVGKPSPAEAQQQWLELLQVPLAHFWQLVLQKQIKQEILVILYGIIQKSPSIVKNQQLRTYMLALKMHDEEMFAQEQIYKVEEDFQREVERGLQTEVEECLGRQLETNKARIRKVSCSNTQTRQESHPAQRRVYRTHQIANADKDAQSLLKSIAFQNSMFRNPKYRQIIQKINEFVIYFASTIRKGEYKLEKFGSLRSNFALSNQYDIDLTFVSPKPRQNQRYIGATCLGQIEKEIISKSFAWYKTSVVYSFPKLPVPYMKMQIDAKKFQQTFSIQNTTKIDITVGNRSAIINSDILFHYASVPQVQSFCILVKFWAKARKVINSKSAMKGFSSYVLILMCIYYLMDTNQIGFLEGDPEKLIENPLGSARLSLKKVQVKGLYENFIGFLQYYRENGKFRGQRKVVNLLKKQLPETFAFNQNFVVNVYDFVDKSNPGRLEMKDKDPIFLEFERMLVLLRQRNIPKIAQVLAGK